MELGIFRWKYENINYVRIMGNGYTRIGFIKDWYREGDMNMVKTHIGQIALELITIMTLINEE